MDLPARIGKYELQEFLGGGMSHVYRALDTVIGRTVAVKILTEEGCQDSEAKARFLAEARMAGNIAHDNVLSIYDFGEDDQHRPFAGRRFTDSRSSLVRRSVHDVPPDPAQNVNCFAMVSGAELSSAAIRSPA